MAECVFITALKSAVIYLDFWLSEILFLKILCVALECMIWPKQWKRQLNSSYQMESKARLLHNEFKLPLCNVISLIRVIWVSAVTCLPAYHTETGCTKRKIICLIYDSIVHINWTKSPLFKTQQWISNWTMKVSCPQARFQG